MQRLAVGLAQHIPGLAVLESIHRRKVHSNDEIVGVHRRHFSVQTVGQPFAESAVGVQFRGGLHVPQQLHAGLEQSGAEGNAPASFNPLRVLAEEVEVEAEVEDPEVRFVFVRAEQPWT